MKTIVLIVFQLMLETGVVVPMNQQTSEFRELYILHPNASIDAFNAIGLEILDANEENIDGATEELAHKYFDKALELEEASNSDKAIVIELCYKGEILNWIQTLEFSYNEDFPDEPVEVKVYE
jgi:hypothetical protein